MPGHHSIEANLRFLIVEVRKQLDRTGVYLRDPSERLLQSVLARDDYIDNLKSFIQKRCFALSPDESWTIDFLKTAEVVAVNLERIADFCESIIAQVGYLEEPEALRELDLQAFLELVVEGMALIEQALFARDVKTALKICRTESKLDRLYSQVFRRILEDLENTDQSQSLVTLLFISHYFERMGDSLLNIGEAIASACLGKAVKIEQLQALADVDPSEPLKDVTLKGFGETRSGCLIARVSSPARAADDRAPAVFKEGRSEKLLEEKEGIERWNRLVPGLAPRVFSFRSDGDSGAILYEYLPGRTFEAILLSARQQELEVALTSIVETLNQIWRKTRVDAPQQSGFLEQLARRLPDVYAVHSEYAAPATALCGLAVPAFAELVEQGQVLEERLQAPFSVLGHGDFNIDNVILDRDGGVRFIDLHRARLTDFAQDVSVFLVSNLRLQVFDARVKRRVHWTVQQFHKLAREFAQEAGDTQFDGRLAFGLVRSLVTSTRFVLDEQLAGSMFLRGRYLLERLLACDPAKLGSFEIPQEILCV